MALDGVPLVKRAKDGPADQLRSEFLDFYIPRLGVFVPLAAYAYEAGARWGDRLKPEGYPSDFIQPGRNGAQPGGLPDLVKAACVLMRVGLLVVDGVAKDAVTRTDGHVSFRGSLFIRAEEGTSAGLYWPGNDKSGVTIDPGYDMGRLTGDQVVADLTGVGVPNSSALEASGGAGRRGPDAGAFARQHRGAVIVTPQQAALLFQNTVPAYEEAVRKSLPRWLLPRLYQHEFDALASLCWNTSRFGRYVCNDDVRRLDLVRAVPDWMTLTAGGPGIIPRRQRETALFERAEYGVLSVRPHAPPAPSGLVAAGGDPV